MILSLASVVTYLHTFSNGFFYVDDEQFITQNIVVTGGAPAFHALYPAANAPFLVYIPLTMLSWRLTWMMGNASPVLFHLIDLLLHIGCAGLACWIIDRLTGKRWVALLMGLAFAVHPLNAEAVVWATQRKDVLSALFALLSFVAYIRNVEDDERPRWLIVSIVAYGAGLLAKVGVVPLPIAFLLFDWVAGRKDAMKLCIEKSWFILVAVPVVMANLYVGESFVGAVGIWPLLLMGAKSIAVLFGLAIVPWTLSSIRWQPEPVTIADPTMIGSLVAVALMIGVTAWLLQKRPTFSMAGFGLAWFMLFLLPTFPSAFKAGLLYYTSEKYAYLPLAGLLIADAIIFIALWERWPKLRMWIGGAAVIIVTLLAMRTFLYVPQWKDIVTYSQYVLRSDPDNPHALANLGLDAEQRGDLHTARDFYERALASDPIDITHYLNAASLANQQGRTADMQRILRSLVHAMTARQLRGDARLVEAILKAALSAAQAGDETLAMDLVKRLSALVPENAAVKEVMGKLQ